MKHSKSEKGSVLVLVVVFLAVLLGMLALVVDYGMGVMLRSRLQSAADSAALAGASRLPESVENAYATAIDYCGKNGVAESEVDVLFYLDAPTRISVRIDRSMNYLFAKILGRTSGMVSAESAAETGVIGGMIGVIPIGVEKTDFTYGDLYTLKRGAGSCEQEGVPGSCSNFGPLALGGTGASMYEYNLINGYNGVLRVGQWVLTETGNMVGPTRRGIDDRVEDGIDETYDNFPTGSRRLVYVPILETLDVGGRSDVKIVGFAAFFLDGFSSKGEVLGRFIRYSAAGDIDPSAEDFELHGVRLVR